MAQPVSRQVGGAQQMERVVLRQVAELGSRQVAGQVSRQVAGQVAGQSSRQMAGQGSRPAAHAAAIRFYQSAEPEFHDCVSGPGLAALSMPGREHRCSSSGVPNRPRSTTGQLHLP